MALVLPNPVLGTGVSDSTKIDANFTEIVSKINGNIDNADIKAGAAIDIDKLNAQYEWMVVRLPVLGAVVPTLAATGLRSESCTPLYNDGKGNWTIVRIDWTCTDTGTGIGKFKVQFGYYDAGGTWTATDYSAAQFISVGGGAGTKPNQGSFAPSVATLAFDANSRSLAVNIAVVDGGAVTAASDSLIVSVLLKRKITAV